MGSPISATHEAPEAASYRADGWWSGDTLDAFLTRAAAAVPDGLAVIDRDRRVTFSELDELVARAAGALRARGVGRGDVVTFQLPNWLEAAIVHHATARLGAVANPVVPIYRERELADILRRSESRVLVVPDRFRGVDHRAMAHEVCERLPSPPHVLVVGDPGVEDESLADALAGADPVEAEPGRSGSDIALLLYTSGTESSPKGVLHSHDTLVCECRSIIELYALGEADVVFMPSPVTHITGLLYGLQLPVMLGIPSVLLDIWAPTAALELIERERCSFTVAATPFLHGIVHHERRGDFDLSSLRVFVCGGAEVPASLIAAARTQLGIDASRVYGASECPTVTGTPPGATEDRQTATDGRPIPPDEVRIVDEDGVVVDPGTPGAVQFRGPDMFLGYLDPELNAGAFTDDGWCRCGDLGVLAPDGYLTVTGREKDIILRGGENLSAKEIEDLLVEHPDVADVAVVAYPDPVLGERACAVVVARREVTLESLTSFLREHRLATQKLPERLRCVDELPRTASGKVQKFRLRALVGDDSTRGAS